MGYSRFWVSRIDGTDLNPNELSELERDITDDLLFDYSDDELEFWFDSESYKGSMLVSVRDRVEPAD